MNLKEYQAMPDNGLYEKIEQRVRRRCGWRVAGAMAAVVMVVGVAAGLLWPRGAAERQSMKPVAVVSTDGSFVIADSNMPEAMETANSPLAAVEQSTPTVAVASAVANASAAAPSTDLASPSSIEVSPLPAKAEASITTMPAASQAVDSPSSTPSINTVSTAASTLPSAEEASVAQAEEETSSIEYTAKVPTKDGEPDPLPEHVDNILWAANVVMPQAEDDALRYFQVKASSALTNFVLTVYNRGGRVVFQTNELTAASEGYVSRSWDGTYKGSLVPQGTYVWIARFRDTAGKVRTERGTVTVVR